MADVSSLPSVCSTLLAGCGADQAVKKGDKFYAVGEYYDAANQYRKAYTQTASKERALKRQRAMKMTECYRRISLTNKLLSRNGLKAARMVSQMKNAIEITFHI